MPLLLSRMPTGEPEIFSSIQGEGASMGVASTFVRLAVCNLQCSWCDTAYTWDWRRYDRAEQVLEAEADTVLAAVRRYAARNIVITGGEPLLQRHGLRPLVESLRAEGYRIEIETNGTIPPGDLAGLIDQWNVSPKLPHSGNEGLRTIRPEAITALNAEANAWFKFVVEEPADVSRVGELTEAHGIDRTRVILMPQGRTRAELEAREAWLAEACADGGYRFSTRLHILLWGDKRGV